MKPKPSSPSGGIFTKMAYRCQQITLEDTFAGLVFMEDLGDENLQTRVQAAPDLSSVHNDYCRLIEILLSMAFRGGENFDLSWTYQTRRYDRDVILQGECRYFVEAFLDGYLGMTVGHETLLSEWHRLADTIMSIEPIGFMHRDFQSRNIMVREEQFYLIDFQGGRSGPPHYDLASLLIDPYVDLPIALRETLLNFFAKRLAQHSSITTDGDPKSLPLLCIGPQSADPGCVWVSDTM